MDLFLINQYRKKLLFIHFFYLFLAALMIIIFFMGWDKYLYIGFKDILNVIFSKNEEWAGWFLIVYAGLVIFFIFLAFKQKKIYDSEIRFELCKNILSNFGVECEKANNSFFDSNILEFYARDYDDIDYSRSHIIKSNHFFGQYFDINKEVETRDSDGNIQTYMENVFSGYIFKFKLEKNYDCNISIKKK
ncbi:hypothetical protein FE773_08965 [Caminibacter mediatlanticus TB-2]|uniref:Poly-beta-1,6-N-acetyl-D-glucosamine biosynthesis protein PgaD n=1 Tax=Caminibacter mediatlanticus TB-2 TaxID=391592 RepID=A0ABX5VCL9_9BACT|nr:hypothetical protein [Caminibacter mediatlanticus]QCT95317.1 hypothetical protein FE773_08965 [Caminibacter mediatlanticus TB-2]